MVAYDPSTETFGALKLFIDNWRWQDVPFFLRTGKRLHTRDSNVTIQFRPVLHQSFPETAALVWQSNNLIINIQPEEGIILPFQAKQSGSILHLTPVDMHFFYKKTFKSKSPATNETLLSDVMAGDATLFMRADQVELAWLVLMPILNVWGILSQQIFPITNRVHGAESRRGIAYERGSELAIVYFLGYFDGDQS